MAKLPPDGLSGARLGNPRAGRDLLVALAARLRSGIDQSDAEMLATALERMAEDDTLHARNAFTDPGVSPQAHRAAGVHRYYDIVCALEEMAWTMSGARSSQITPEVISAFLREDRGLDRKTVMRALEWCASAEAED